MKQYISDDLNIFLLVTGENSTHYICGTILFAKDDVITDYHPEDNTIGLRLVIRSFVNY